MGFARFCIRRPVAVAMALTALIIFGLIAYTRLPVALLPDLAYPYVTVATVYPNADPNTVEQSVTNPLEAAINGISGVRRVDSASLANVSVIVIEFGWNTRLDSALAEVRSRVDASASTLPQGVQRPIVIPIDPSAASVLTLALQSPAGEAATDAALVALIPTLARIDGVADVRAIGRRPREVRVAYDPQKLAEAGLDPLKLAQLLNAQNAIVPAGLVTDQGAELQALAGNRLRTLDDLRGLVIAQGQPDPGSWGLAALIPQPVHLGDVAEITLGPAPAGGAVEFDNRAAVLLGVVKRQGANTVAVSRAVRVAVADWNATHPAARVEVVDDQAEAITNSLRDLKRNALIGAALAIGVLWLFLGEWGSVAVVALAVPFSLIASCLVMYLLGLSLNLMTLGGLALGVGMLVDNAIVVIESIYRRRRRVTDPVTAAALGTGEVMSAVVASTVTSLVVFLPLLLMQSLAGHLVREIGYAVSISLAASLAVALSALPVLAARLLRRRARLLPAAFAAAAETAAAAEGALGGAVGLGATESRPLFDRLRDAYSSALSAWLHHPGRALWLCALLAVGSGLLVMRLPLQFLPALDEGKLSLEVALDPGTPLAQTEATARRAVKLVLADPAVAHVAMIAGDVEGDDPLAKVNGAGNHVARLTVVLTPRDGRAASALIEARLLDRLAAEGLSARRAQSVSDMALGAGSAITVSLFGPSLDTLHQLRERLMAGLREGGAFRRVEPLGGERTPTLLLQDEPLPSLTAGLTAAQIGLAAHNALSGDVVTSLQTPEGALPLRLEPAGDHRALPDLLDLRIPTEVAGMGPARLGGMVAPVRELTDTAIHHVDRVRTLQLVAVPRHTGATAAAKRIQAAAGTLDLPPGYGVNVSGSFDLLKQTERELTIAFALAVLLVYMVMAAQFESLAYPLAVMFVVPLAAFGALLGLFLTHNPLSVPAVVGVIMLIGIAVNNGIVLIDFANQLQRDGVALREALILAGRTRLRPILMTALTTVIGMVPMALSHGQGSEIEIPLAIGVIFGLSLATLLTLFVVPAVYLLLHRRRAPRHRAGTAGLLLVLAIAALHPPHAAAAGARLDLNLSAGGAFAPALSYAADFQDVWGELVPHLRVEAAPRAHRLGAGAGATLTFGPASPWSLDAAWAERVDAAGAGGRVAGRIGWSRPGDALSVALGRQDPRYGAGDDLFDRLARPSGAAAPPARWLVAQADHRTPEQTTWRLAAAATPRAQDLLVGPSLQWGGGTFRAGVGAVHELDDWAATFALEYGFRLRSVRIQLGAAGPDAFAAGYRTYLGIAGSRLHTDLQAWWSRPAATPVVSAVVTAETGTPLSWRLAYQSGAGVEVGVGVRL